jgi:hypothetical protein
MWKGCRLRRIINSSGVSFSAGVVRASQCQRDVDALILAVVCWANEDVGGGECRLLWMLAGAHLKLPMFFDEMRIYRSVAPGVELEYAQ